MPFAEVIGDPIDHSLSPAIHNYWLRALGMDGRFCTARVQSEGLAEYFLNQKADPDWRGCSVTAPHKLAVLAHIDAVSEPARQIGAVNCVVREGGALYGLNTDVDGVREALAGIDLKGRKVVLIGAGGAARAALAGLEEKGCGETVLLVRDPSKAAALLARSGGRSALPFERAAEALDGASLAINATPLGMSGTASPRSLCAALSGMTLGGTVFDMVYQPLHTPLIQAGRAQRLITIDGLTMLIGQARQAFRRFFHAEPPSEHDAGLRVQLAAR